MFWRKLHDAIEAWLKEDAAVAALCTVRHGNEDVVDILQGLTAVEPSPGIRILRGPASEIRVTDAQSGDIPETITIFIDVWAAEPTDADRSASKAYAAIDTMEDAVLKALRGFFAPTRSLSRILGAAFEATVSNLAPVDEQFTPALGSRFTLTLNRKGT